MSLYATRARHLLLRPPPENGDTIALINQFHDEGRWRAVIREKKDMASRPGHGNIEKAALLGIRMFLWRSKDQIEDRIIGYLGWKTMFSRAQTEHHHVVSFEPFRAMHRHVFQSQAGIFPSQNGHVLGPSVPVPAQQ